MRQNGSLTGAVLYCHVSLGCVVPLCSIVVRGWGFLHISPTRDILADVYRKVYFLLLSDSRVSFHVPYIVFQNVKDIMNLCIGNAVTWGGDVPCVTSGVI